MALKPLQNFCNVRLIEQPFYSLEFSFFINASANHSFQIRIRSDTRRKRRNDVSQCYQ